MAFLYAVEGLNTISSSRQLEETQSKYVDETFSWNDFYTKWTTVLSSGNVPDMSTALVGHVTEMINSDALVPFNHLIDDIGRDKFSENAINEGTVDGNNYSIPLYSHAMVMWVRKDLLEQNGLEVAQNMGRVV